MAETIEQPIAATGLDRFGQAILDPTLKTPNGVVNPDGQPATKRFDVYRNNVVVSLIEALAARCPAVKLIVGDSNFTFMAREFVRKNPPRSPVMLDYGKDFPDFIAAFAPAAELPHLADVARLDSARRTAYHAVDANPLDPTRLATIAPEQLEQLRFTLHPSLKFVASEHAVVDIWQCTMEDRPLENADDGPQTAMIVRPAFDVIVYRLPDGALAFFDALLAHKTLAEASEAGLLANPHFDLSETLTLALRAGVFVDFA